MKQETAREMAVRAVNVLAANTIAGFANQAIAKRMQDRQGGAIYDPSLSLDLRRDFGIFVDEVELVRSSVIAAIEEKLDPDGGNKQNEEGDIEIAS